MKLMPVLLLALAACSPAADSDGNGSAGATNAAPTAATPASAADSSEALTGLYEGSGAVPRDQLCIVEDGKSARFGLVVWGGGQHSCSGTGTVTRKGGTLRLAMAGDETCAIDAPIRDGVVTLPDSIPQGCAYYCGARASLAGARFARTAGGEAASRKATDLVGEPLCHPER